MRRQSKDTANNENSSEELDTAEQFGLTAQLFPSMQAKFKFVAPTVNM